MFARTKKLLYPPAAVLVLSVLVLALLPTVAEAQETAKTKTPPVQRAEHVVVRPGDTLWSISSDLLGPNASPRRIAEVTQRIYALNRGVIGSDPNLIFQGQKLLLPAVSERSAARPVTRSMPARNTAKPAEAGPPARGPKSETDQASKGTVNEAGNKAGQVAPAPVAEAAAHPDMPTKRLTSKADSSSVTDARSPVESFGVSARALLLTGASAIVGVPPQDPLFERKLLGLGIYALTFIVAGLMVARKLRLRLGLRDAKSRRIPTGYHGRYAGSEPLERYDHALVPPVQERAPHSREDTLRAPVVASAPEQDADGSNGRVATAENGLGVAGVIRTLKERQERTRLTRAARLKRRSHGGARSGAYGRDIRRVLSSTALETRPQRSANSSGRPWVRGSLGMGVIPRERSQGYGPAREPSPPGAETEPLPDPRVLLLSTRQWETLELAALGLTNAQIARHLFITESTVKQHLRKAYRTLGLRGRQEATGIFGLEDQAGRRQVEEEVRS